MLLGRKQQTSKTITCYPTQSCYLNIEAISPCPILIMPSTWLGSDKYKFDKSLVWLDHAFNLTISRTQDPCSTDLATSPQWNVRIKFYPTRVRTRGVESLDLSKRYKFVSHWFDSTNVCPQRSSAFIIILHRSNCDQLRLNICGTQYAKAGWLSFS